MNQKRSILSLKMDYVQLYIFRHSYTHWPIYRFGSDLLG